MRVDCSLNRYLLRVSFLILYFVKWKVERLHSAYILSRFMIRLNILPDNLQLAATSSSRTNSLSFFLDPVYDLTRSTPLRLAVGHDVIQLRSIRCNYI